MTVFCEECKHLPNCELAKHEEVDGCKRGESMTDKTTDNIINEINEKQIKEGRTLHLYEIREIIDKNIKERNSV